MATPVVVASPPPPTQQQQQQPQQPAPATPPLPPCLECGLPAAAHAIPTDANVHDIDCVTCSGIIYCGAARQCISHAHMRMWDSYLRRTRGPAAIPYICTKCDVTGRGAVPPQARRGAARRAPGSAPRAGGGAGGGAAAVASDSDSDSDVEEQPAPRRQPARRRGGKK